MKGFEKDDWLIFGMDDSFKVIEHKTLPIKKFELAKDAKTIIFNDLFKGLQ